MATPPSAPPSATYYFPGTRTVSPKHPPIGGPPPMPPGYAHPPGYPAADVEAGLAFAPAAQAALARDDLAAPLLHPAAAFPGGPGGSTEDYVKHQRRIRHGFLRKVFGLLTVTLLVTTATTALFRLHPPVARYTLAHPWTLWLATAGTFITILALAFSDTLRRTHPYNLIVLLVFSVLESLLVATASAMFRTDILFLAAAITAATTALLTAFALQTKFDLTASTGLLLGSLTAVVVASFVNIFWQAPGFTIATAGLSALVFSVYIVYDVQLVVGGEHLYALSEDEYVFATLNLYLDIINLFLALLRLLDYTSGSSN